MGVCRWVSPALGTTGIRRRGLGWVRAGFVQVTGEEALEKQDLGGGAREAMQDGGEAGRRRPRPVSSDIGHQAVCWGGAGMTGQTRAQLVSLSCKRQRACQARKAVSEEGQVDGTTRKAPVSQRPVGGWREALELLSSHLRPAGAAAWAVGGEKEESEGILSWKDRRMPSLPEWLDTVASQDLGPTGAPPGRGPLRTFSGRN